MALLARVLARAVVGGRIDPRVTPVAAISFVYSASLSTFWVYVGIYAVRGLHWPASRVGLLFLVSAPTAAVANYLSGRLSDQVGSRRPITGSFLVSSLTMVALASFGSDRLLAFGLICGQGVIGAPAFSLHRVLVADIVPADERRENAYATLRIAANLGAVGGPPLAAILIATGGWTSFLLAVAALGVIGAGLAFALLPREHVTPPVKQKSARLVSVVRDRPFALLLLSTVLAFNDYCGFESVLPVVAVTAYGVAPSTWGLLVAISPVLVIFGQLRVTRASAAVAAHARLALATLLMGLPFLVLLASGTLPAIATVVVLFSVGEMIWQPTSQSLAAQLAPTGARGTYFGAFAAMTGPAWTLIPFIAFKLRAHVGVDAVWLMFAAIAVGSAAAGLTAVRIAAGQGRLRAVAREVGPPRSR